MLAVLFVMPSARADVPIVIFDGAGWGHGVGLSQWGAEYQARHGKSTAEILAGFYPGTELTNRGGQVRVSVYTSPNRTARLSFPDGGEIRSSPGGQQAAGFPVRIGPGGSVQVGYDGSYTVSGLVRASATGDAVLYADSGCGLLGLEKCPDTTTTTAGHQGGGGGGGTGCGLLGLGKCHSDQPARTTTTTQRPSPTTTRSAPQAPSHSPTTTTRAPQTTPTAPEHTAGDGTIRSSTPLWAVPNGGGATTALDRGRSYRGLIEVTTGAGPLRLVNQLDVETYLKGMGEVPGSWPDQAIGAQAVVARTYALRAMAASGEICDYDLCQVYVGTSKETPGQTAAVDATRGQVLTYGGELASTVYSADAGGVSATTLEGFGTPDGIYPYLTTVTYETDNPLPWRTEVGYDDLARRFGYGGTLSDVFISEEGPSGRALTVTLRGDAGDRTVDGRKFSSKLGLRSTLWKRTLTTADAAPPRPPSFGTTQALPTDSEAITAGATQGEDQAEADAQAEQESTAVLGALATIDLDPSTVAMADRPVSAMAVGLLGAVTAAALAQWGPPVEDLVKMLSRSRRRRMSIV